MTTAFTPQGSKAKWEQVFEVFSGHQSGDTVSYAEIDFALDGVHTRTQVQGIVYQAARRLLERENKALEAIPNIGYRIVQANEHVRLAGKQQGRASRALARGTRQVVHVDLNGLTEVEKALVQATGHALAAQADYMRRLDIRQKRTERAVATVTKVQSEQSEEMQRLQERIARLEQEHLSGHPEEGEHPAS